MSEFSSLASELRTLVPEDCRISLSYRNGDWRPRELANEAKATAWQARIEWPDNGAHWGADGMGPPVLVRYGMSGESAMRALVDALRSVPDYAKLLDRLEAHIVDAEKNGGSSDAPWLAKYRPLIDMLRAVQP